jgi:preprotein translocase subunit SecE
MATEEDVKRDEESPAEEPEDEPRAPSEEPSEETGADAAEPAKGKAGQKIDDPSEPEPDPYRTSEAPEAGPEPVAAPGQLGTKRFVYAFYFGGAIGIAFIASKLLDYAWFRLQAWKPVFGEPNDTYVTCAAAALGGGIALYYWYRTRARQLAEEVATEMSKVTYPSRTEVTNGTFVVIVTAVVSTVFFALMDQFWRFITKLVYGG